MAATSESYSALLVGGLHAGGAKQIHKLGNGTSRERFLKQLELTNNSGGLVHDARGLHKPNREVTAPAVQRDMHRRCICRVCPRRYPEQVDGERRSKALVSKFAQNVVEFPGKRPALGHSAYDDSRVNTAENALTANTLCWSVFEATKPRRRARAR